jgi:hypothetical protein
VTSTTPLGPDPNDLLKDVSRVFSSTAAGDKSFGKVVAIDYSLYKSWRCFRVQCLVWLRLRVACHFPSLKFSLRPKLSFYNK